MNDTARKILFKNAKPDTRVHRVWDIGASDLVTVTWIAGDKTLLERTFRGRALPEIVPMINAEPFAPIGDDYVRADASIPQWDTGRTPIEVMTALGLRPVVVRR